MMDVGSNKSRKDARAVISLVARYRSPSTFEYVQEACCDVSVGGMFIKSPDPAAAGTLLKLECEADRDGGKIRGVARVVWLRREGNEFGPSGMGVKFVKLETGSKETITRIVADLAAAGVEATSISSAPEARGKPRGSVRVGSPVPAAPSAAVAAAPLAIAASEKASVSTIPSKPPSPPAKKAPEAAPAANISNSPTGAFPQLSESEPPPTAAAPQAAPAQPAPVQPAPVQPAPVQIAQDVRSPMPNPTPLAQDVTRALEKHAARTAPTSQRSAPLEIASEKPGGSRRALWLVGVAAAALLIYIFTDEARKPKPADTAPIAQQAQPAEPAPPPTAASPSAQDTPTEPATTTATSPEARVEPPSQPSAAPTEAPTAAAAAEHDQPAAPSANDTPEVTAEDEAKAAAALPSERPALPPGQMPYVITFITTPTGASVTIGTQTIVAPGDIDLGVMPARVRVTAVKDGFEPTSALLDHSEFAKSADGKIRRRVYLKLQPLGAVPKAAAPAVVPAAAAAPKPASPAATTPPASAAPKAAAATTSAVPPAAPRPTAQAPATTPTAAAPKPAVQAPAVAPAAPKPALPAAPAKP